MTTKANNREEGIEAIIALQKHVGINEPRAHAEANWDAFTPYQKEQTLLAYKFLCEHAKHAANTR